jgi:predicted AlkP superfamily pyrophosphatase or phosphodiesterase
MNKTHLLPLLAISVLLGSCEPDEELSEYDCEEWTTACADSSIVVDPLKSNRKVLIIGIDGFRADAMQDTITPFLFSLAQSPNTYYTNQNHVQSLTFSGPNWSSLCTGVDFCKHMVTTNGFGDNHLVEYPHFFQYIEQANSSKNTVSVVNWTPINTHLSSPFADYSPTESITDHDVFLITNNLLLQGVPLNPDILFLQFDELDGAGHSYGFHPNVPEYRATLNTLDAYIDSIYSIIEAKRSNGEEWLFCVISDHGGDGKGHSGKYDNEHVKHTIMFMNAPLESFKHWHTSSQTDLAPTVLDYLGIESAEFNCKTDGISVLQ